MKSLSFIVRSWPWMSILHLELMYCWFSSMVGCDVCYSSLTLWCNSDVIRGLNLRSNTAVETGQFGWVAPFQHHYKVVKDHFLFVVETLCLYFVLWHVFDFSFLEKWNTLTSSIHFWFRWRLNSAVGSEGAESWNGPEGPVNFLLIDRCKGSLGVFMIGEHGMSCSG